MDLKIKIFDQVAAAKTGQKTVNEATNEILILLNVVGQSEQLTCPKCGDYGTIDNQDGTVSTCPCHY